MKRRYLILSFLLLLPVSWANSQQAQIDTGIRGQGPAAIRIAVPLFESTSGSNGQQLSQIFNQVLWDDLAYSGNLELASRSFYPLGKIAGPGDVRVDEWTKAPVQAQYMAFGSTALTGNRFTADAHLW